MKKLPVILLLTLVYTSFPGHAQQISKYTLEEIRKQVSDPNSNYYYPVLLKKFNDNTKLTKDEAVMVYYGFPTQEMYAPYQNWQLEKELLIRNGNLRKKELQDSLLHVTQALLEMNPVSLLGNYTMAVLQQIKGNKTLAAAYKQRFGHLYKAVRTTGIGKKPETAPVLISSADKYPYLQKLGLGYRGEEQVEQNGQFYDKTYYGNVAATGGGLIGIAIGAAIKHKLYFNTSIPKQKDVHVKDAMEEWLSQHSRKK